MSEDLCPVQERQELMAVKSAEEEKGQPRGWCAWCRLSLQYIVVVEEFLLVD